MDTTNFDDPKSDSDQAIARRLAKLRTMPVDTSRLDKALRAEILQPGSERRMRLTWLRPVRAVAASITILGILTVVLLSSSAGPVLASPIKMAQAHQDLVSGRVPVMQVDSIQSANKALAAASPPSPEIPDVPQNHVMACCMSRLGTKTMACVLMKTDGVPVSMMVAAADDVRSPKSPTMVRAGITYHVQAYEAINMVMTKRDGRWICLVGELPTEKLIDLADALKF
jgi:hypothetical protein